MLVSQRSPASVVPGWRFSPSLVEGHRQKSAGRAVSSAGATSTRGTGLLVWLAWGTVRRCWQATLQVPHQPGVQGWWCGTARGARALPARNQAGATSPRGTGLLEWLAFCIVRLRGSVAQFGPSSPRGTGLLVTGRLRQCRTGKKAALQVSHHPGVQGCWCDIAGRPRTLPARNQAGAASPRGTGLLVRLAVGTVLLISRLAQIGPSSPRGTGLLVSDRLQQTDFRRLQG